MFLAKNSNFNIIRIDFTEYFDYNRIFTYSDFDTNYYFLLPSNFKLGIFENDD